MATGAPGAHPWRRAPFRSVLSPTRAYSTLKLGPHPQSCAVSTPRPMKAPGSLQARRSSSGFRGRATPTKHHVARVRVARAFAELREPGTRARTGACERSERRCCRREERRACISSPWETLVSFLRELLQRLLFILLSLDTPLLFYPPCFLSLALSFFSSDLSLYLSTRFI